MPITTKQEFAQKVKDISIEIMELIKFFDEQNKPGQQFDYCTAPNVQMSTLELKARALDNRWFQNNGD